MGPLLFWLSTVVITAISRGDFKCCDSDVSSDAESDDVVDDDDDIDLFLYSCSKPGDALTTAKMIVSYCYVHNISVDRFLLSCDSEGVPNWVTALARFPQDSFLYFRDGAKYLDMVHQCTRGSVRGIDIAVHWNHQYHFLKSKFVLEHLKDYEYKDLVIRGGPEQYFYSRDDHAFLLTVQKIVDEYRSHPLYDLILNLI